MSLEPCATAGANVVELLLLLLLLLVRKQREFEVNGGCHESSRRLNRHTTRQRVSPACLVGDWYAHSSRLVQGPSLVGSHLCDVSITELDDRLAAG